MPRTRNNWSKPPVFVHHRSCQICNGRMTYQADAGGGRTIGGCHKPRCKKLVDIDANAARHMRFVPRHKVANDPLWALFGVTPECLLGKAGPAPTNWTVLRSNGGREPGWRLDTDYHHRYAWDITCGTGGKWHIPAVGPEVAKGATLEDLKHSLDPVHHHVVDAFEARLNAMYAAEATDHKARAAIPNPLMCKRSPFARLAEKGMLNTGRPFDTYAVMPDDRPGIQSCGAAYCLRPVTAVLQCWRWRIHSCADHAQLATLSAKAFMNDIDVVALQDLVPEMPAVFIKCSTPGSPHPSEPLVALEPDKGGEMPLYPLSARTMMDFGCSETVANGVVEVGRSGGAYMAFSAAHDTFMRRNRVPLDAVEKDPVFDAVKAAGGLEVTRSSGAVEKGWSVATENPNYDGEPMLLFRNSKTEPWCLLALSPGDEDTWKTMPVVWLKKSLPETQHALVDAFIARLEAISTTA